MAKIRYEKNIKGLNELMRSAGVRDHLRAVAEAAIPYAQEISPERTGEYKASFRVETTDSGGPLGNRAAAYLINDSPHAARVEWEDDFHVLARVADHIQHGGA
jgi:hypothetical protein